MPDLLHRLNDGGSISVDGANVVICVPGGKRRLPMALSFSGEAVVALLLAAQRANGSRSHTRKAWSATAGEAARARARLKKVANG